MRLDRILAAIGAGLLACGTFAWSIGPAAASFLPAGNSNDRIVWSSSRPQPAPINESNGELGLWTVDPTTVICTSGGSPCTAWSQGDISELTGFDAQHCPNGNNDDQPFYSPNGDKVVYRSDCNGANHAIWEVLPGVGVQQGIAAHHRRCRRQLAVVRARQPHRDLRAHERPRAALEDRRRRTSARVRRSCFSDPNADAFEPRSTTRRTRPRSSSSRSSGAHDEIILLDTTASTLTNLSRLSAGETGCTTPVGSPFGPNCSTPDLVERRQARHRVRREPHRLPEHAAGGRRRPGSDEAAALDDPVQQRWRGHRDEPDGTVRRRDTTTGFADTNPAYSPQNDNVVFQRTTGAGDIEDFSMGVSSQNHGNGPPTGQLLHRGCRAAGRHPELGLEARQPDPPRGALRHHHPGHRTARRRHHDRDPPAPPFCGRRGRLTPAHRLNRAPRRTSLRPPGSGNS